MVKNSIENGFNDKILWNNKGKNVKIAV